MRRARLAGLTAVLAIAASACSLLTSLDGLSGAPLRDDVPDGDARADVGATPSSDGSIDGDLDASRDTSAASDALDGGDQAGPNLHPQGTFETGTCAPWGGFQGTLEIVSTAHTGSGACRACTLPMTPDYFTADDNLASGPGVVGATYHAEGWVRADPSRPPPPGVVFFLRNATNVNGTFTSIESGSSSKVTVDATWLRLEATLTFTKPGDLNVFVGGDNAPNACFLLDDVVVRRVP